MFTGELSWKDDLSVASCLLFNLVLFISRLIIARACKVSDVGTKEADPSLAVLAILADVAPGVVQVQLTILNDQVTVSEAKVCLILRADPSLRPALAVDKTATDVELEAALEVSVHAGPLVVGARLLEAAQVVGEARVRIRHSTPSVDSSPDRTGRCVSPIKPPQTIRRVHELGLRVSDVLVALEVDDGLYVGSVGVVRADGAELVLQEHLIVLRVKLEAAALNLAEAFMSHLTFGSLDEAGSGVVWTTGGLGVDHRATDVEDHLAASGADLLHVIIIGEGEDTEVDLALWGLDAAGDDLVWGTRQLCPPLPGVVTEVTRALENLRVSDGDVMVTQEHDVYREVPVDVALLV